MRISFINSSSEELRLLSGKYQEERKELVQKIRTASISSLTIAEYEAYCYIRDMGIPDGPDIDDLEKIFIKTRNSRHK